MLLRYKWLDKATAKVHFPPDRRQVRQELSNHIEDLREHYIEIGMDTEAAEAAAVEAMGKPEDIAEDLGRIHRAWPGYLWWVSRALLIATAVLCCGLMVFHGASSVWNRLPGYGLYDYLTWKFEGASGEPGQYELVPNGSVTTGGYTIRNTGGTMKRNSDPSREERHWSLFLDFHIDAGWRGEELYWGGNVISEIRDDAGNTYGSQGGDSPKCWRSGSSSAVPLLGQKAAMELQDVPEDAEWIEIDLGYGALRRTMHIDLQEAVS